jgi:hypothetical protein
MRTLMILVFCSVRNGQCLTHRIGISGGLGKSPSGTDLVCLVGEERCDVCSMPGTPRTRLVVTRIRSPTGIEPEHPSLRNHQGEWFSIALEPLAAGSTVALQRQPALYPRLKHKSQITWVAAPSSSVSSRMVAGTPALAKVLEG